MTNTSGSKAAKKAVKRTATKRTSTPTVPDAAKVAEARRTIDALAEKIAANTEDRGGILYDAAVTYSRVVSDGLMTGGDFADRFYGKRDEKGEPVKHSAGAMATILKRLADAATRLGVERDSLEWRFLVQQGGTPAGGAAIKTPNKATAKRVLTSKAKEWAKTGKNTASSRKPSSAKDTAKATEKATPQQVLASVEKYVREMPADDLGDFITRMNRMLTVVSAERKAKGSNRSARTGQATEKKSA